MPKLMILRCKSVFVASQVPVKAATKPRGGVRTRQCDKVVVTERVLRSAIPSAPSDDATPDTEEVRRRAADRDEGVVEDETARLAVGGS